MTWRRVAIAVLLVCASGSPSPAGEVRTKVRNIEDGKRVVDLYTRPDARQRVLVLVPKGKASAAVILFAGGSGKTRIHKDGTVGRAGNFLVRSRGRFVKQGFVTAVFDVPSDQDTLRDNRTEDWHVRDVAAVVSYLKRTYRLAVWLVGTSRGTMTVGYAGAKLTQRIDGVAFTSSMDDAVHLPIEEIAVPAFVMHHADDDCFVTDPSSAKDIAEGLKKSPKVALVYLKGGKDEGDPCQARAYHGYNGIEDEAVGRIAAFIKANTKK